MSVVSLMTLSRLKVSCNVVDGAGATFDRTDKLVKSPQNGQCVLEPISAHKAVCCASSQLFGRSL
jgi:hypothetical protein